MVRVLWPRKKGSTVVEKLIGFPFRVPFAVILIPLGGQLPPLANAVTGPNWPSTCVPRGLSLGTTFIYTQMWTVLQSSTNAPLVPSR